MGQVCGRTTVKRKPCLPPSLRPGRAHLGPGYTDYLSALWLLPCTPAPWPQQYLSPHHMVRDAFVFPGLTSFPLSCKTLPGPQGHPGFHPFQSLQYRPLQGGHAHKDCRGFLSACAFSPMQPGIPQVHACGGVEGAA